MLPGAYDLNLYRGDTTRVTFVLWIDPGRTMPVDLTGATAKAQIRDRPDSTSILVELGCAVTLPNSIEVAVPTATAGKLKPKGAWDLQLTWSSGDIQTVVAGAVTAAPDVTRV